MPGVGQGVGPGRAAGWVRGSACVLKGEHQHLGVAPRPAVRPGVQQGGAATGQGGPSDAAEPSQTHRGSRA